MANCNVYLYKFKNYYLNKNLDKNSIECNAVIIGTWFIPKKGNVVIYMFSDKDEYFTGQFIYQLNKQINKFDIVVVKYNPANPSENKCIRIEKRYHSF